MLTSPASPDLILKVYDLIHLSWINSYSCRGYTANNCTSFHLLSGCVLPQVHTQLIFSKPILMTDLCPK